jgi:hypothetical protein
VLYKGISGGEKLMTLRGVYQSVRQRMALLKLPEPQFTSMATAADLAMVANAAYDTE